MRKLLTLLLISTVVLSACSRDSRIRPSNWFSGSSSKTVATAQTAPAEVNPLIPKRESKLRLRQRRTVYRGTPVEQVTNVTVERIPTGAIVNVTGLTRRQDAFDIRLTSDSSGEPVDGVLSFTLKALQLANAPQGTQRRRTVRVARFISNHDLEKTDTVQIIAVGNTLTTQP